MGFCLIGKIKKIQHKMVTYVMRGAFEKCAAWSRFFKLGKMTIQDIQISL